MRRSAETVLQAPRQLTFAQDDSTVTIVDEQDLPVSLHTDNRKLEIETAYGREVEIRAQWKGRYLVLEQKYEAAKVTARYFPAPTTDQLYVIVHVEMDRMPDAIEFRRVYDPAPTSR